MPLTPKRLFDSPSSMVTYKKQRISRPLPVTRRPLIPEVKELLLPFNIAQINNLGFQAVLCTDIVQGTSANNRLGNRVKLLSIEITAKNEFASMLVVCPKNAFIAPTAANFSLSVAPFYDADQGWTLMSWQPDFPNSTVVQYGALKKKFPNGMDVQWDGTSACKNHIYLCFYNRSGSNAVNISGTIRLRYVDA